MHESNHIIRAFTQKLTWHSNNGAATVSSKILLPRIVFIWLFQPVTHCVLVWLSALRDISFNWFWARVQRQSFGGFNWNSSHCCSQECCKASRSLVGALGQSQLGEDRWDLAISPSLDLYNIPPKLPHRSADLHYMYYTKYDFEKYGFPFSKYDLQSPICIILPQKPPTQILPIYLFWRRFVQCLGVNSGFYNRLNSDFFTIVWISMQMASQLLWTPLTPLWSSLVLIS